ncbi:g212 [Coccomyxa viridis]|uniref:G212 protein n=1 Tax=Coccomyxa viridis TaxID=1274662 RepID=A0ABP1FJ87_9CHLO
MASTSIPLLRRLRQLLSAVYPMPNECAASVAAPMLAQPTSGLVPNIWWKAVSIDQLRSHPSYAALPAAPPPLHPSTYRYVRQESPLWSALHNGVLTSSTLNGALGFYEPGAVQRLGLPKHFVRHGALLAAYSNLLQPEYVPPSQSIAPLASTQGGPRQAADPNSNSSSSSGGSKTLAQVWQDAATTGTPGAQPSSAVRSSATKKKGKGAPSKGFHSSSAGPIEDEQASHRLRTCIGSIRCKWGSVQEATALWEFMHAVPQGALEEVGLCRVEPAVLRDQYGFAEGQLPPMGASPDGLVRQRQASPASAALTALRSAFAGMWALTALRSAFAGMSVRDDSSSGNSVQECEVVEVKNTCPFRQRTSLTKKGNPRMSYMLADPGPRERVNQMWVTQLQLEMLAAPAQSALLVSRSASKGMTVFRMWRDEAYLQAMLGYVSIFYTSFVLSQKQPPSNIFLELPEYQQFLQHTLSLAHGAEVVLHVPPEQMPAESGDLRTFLN